ncbi:hypothetical protein SCLCIDRAFT_1213637 [Scleroderma citrinum Foug A]|uniref:Yeast cell wall synthesis Kre9/Knh1-like N-terminal domain-containing protein n=1 Tax=Scleroderma citrinum Foug A TaxID=1036808 RepID=A0A0C3DUB1_9AGAM|nr:hypothetical protein SCLCIDRAFT_1213637 [Scleroderma citrinum Foug A]
MMFAQLFTALLALPLVFALTINPLTEATTGGTVTITWSATSSDPAYFSIELVNPSFHNTFAIANNVETSLGQLTIQLPQVPVDSNYQLEAINPSNVNDVYSTSATFSIGAQTTATSSPTSTAPSSTGTGTATGPTTSNTSTGSASATPSGSGTGTSSTTATPTSFNNSGARSVFSGFGGAWPAAVLVLSCAAGAALLY